MIIDTFNRRAAISKRASEMKQDSTSLRGGLRFNASLDPGFEGFGEKDDIAVGDGAVVAHFASSAEDDDSILTEAVARGDYFQMPALELRAEL